VTGFFFFPYLPSPDLSFIASLQISGPFLLGPAPHLGFYFLSAFLVLTSLSSPPLVRFVSPSKLRFFLFCPLTGRLFSPLHQTIGVSDPRPCPRFLWLATRPFPRKTEQGSKRLFFFGPRLTLLRPRIFFSKKRRPLPLAATLFFPRPGGACGRLPL